jgi:hypothetical protein
MEDFGDRGGEEAAVGMMTTAMKYFFSVRVKRSVLCA